MTKHSISVALSVSPSVIPVYCIGMFSTVQSLNYPDFKGVDKKWLISTQKPSKLVPFTAHQKKRKEQKKNMRKHSGVPMSCLTSFLHDKLVKLSCEVCTVVCAVPNFKIFGAVLCCVFFPLPSRVLIRERDGALEEMSHGASMTERVGGLWGIAPPHLLSSTLFSLPRSVALAPCLRTRAAPHHGPPLLS